MCLFHVTTLVRCQKLSKTAFFYSSGGQKSENVLCQYSWVPTGVSRGESSTSRGYWNSITVDSIAVWFCNNMLLWSHGLLAPCNQNSLHPPLKRPFVIISVLCHTDSPCHSLCLCLPLLCPNPDGIHPWM